MDILMEWILLVVDSTGKRRRFPFELGRQWIAGRYEHPADAVNRAASEGATDSLFLDEMKYMPLEPDSLINRWHCLFDHGADGPSVEDLGSRGTYLNGASIAGKHSLHHGDVVRVAKCEVSVICTATSLTAN